ncbi:hypothetical protein Fot_08987 [Forsythia ovata]|uniref:Uncharacterized protein n=1 Tax=Forsythia ovata TaxID=205694 RepID=A0ABD1WD13_9LAMI
MARALVLVQDQNMELEISVAQVAKLEEETIQQRKAVEKLKRKLESAMKDSEVEKLRADVRWLMIDFEVLRVSAAASKEKLQRHLEDKRDKLNMFQAQQKSWEEGLALKDEELGLLTKIVETQCQSLAGLPSEAEGLRKKLLNYREY